MLRVAQGDHEDESEGQEQPAHPFHNMTHRHLCTANGPSARALGTHDPLDPAAPEGKLARHMVGRGMLA